MFYISISALHISSDGKCDFLDHCSCVTFKWTGEILND